MSKRDLQLFPCSQAVAWWLMAGCVSLVLLPGCGQSGPKGAVGKVHGTMKKGEKGVPGTIYFNSPAGAGTGTVAADGTYKLGGEFGDKIPAGDYKVSFSPASSGGMDSGNLAAPPGSSPSGGIPAKYLNADTSGWTAVVKEGENTFDFKVE